MGTADILYHQFMATPYLFRDIVAVLELFQHLPAKLFPKSQIPRSFSGEHLVLPEIASEEKYRRMPTYGSRIMTRTHERVLTGSLLLEISMTDEYTAIAMFRRYRRVVNNGQILDSSITYFLPT